MIRVFVDSSVLFAAVHSGSGFARDLLRLSISHNVQLVVSSYVTGEIERNLAEKAPEKGKLFKAFQEVVAFEMVEPDETEVKTAAEYTVLKDAPVVAAAIKAQVAYLVTYDRKHLIDPPQVAAKSGLKIVTPDVVVKALEDVPPDEPET